MNEPMNSLHSIQEELLSRGAVIVEVPAKASADVLKELLASEEQRLAKLIRGLKELAMGWPAPFEPQRAFFWERAS